MENLPFTVSLWDGRRKGDVRHNSLGSAPLENSTERTRAANHRDVHGTTSQERDNGIQTFSWLSIKSNVISLLY